MSECKCNLREKLVGDGCGVCNPAKYLEYARETIEELTQQRDMLLEALKEIAALNIPIDIVDIMDETARKAVDIADAAIAAAEGEK